MFKNSISKKQRLKLLFFVLPGIAWLSLVTSASGQNSNNKIQAHVNESAELFFMESDPRVYIEVENVCNGVSPCEWQINTTDEDIAAQVRYLWSAEIRCQNRIKSLEVDHPGTVRDANSFPRADAIYSTLEQTLPTESPFKSGIAGTFFAQSFQVELLKRECLERINDGLLNPTNEYSEPSFYLEGDGANRLFLRCECSTLAGEVTESFINPAANSNQPDGVAYSPYTTVVCYDINSQWGPQLNLKPTTSNQTVKTIRNK